MSDPVALVTGGSQGIGKAIVRHFATLGFLVVIADNDDEAGLETAAEIPKVHFQPCDVSRENEVRELMAMVDRQYGRLDVLVNNAGIMIRKPMEGLALEEWNRVLGINLTGPWLCAKYAAPRLRKVGGRIVNVASTRALMSEPDTEAYSASKGGIVSLTHSLAVSLGPQIRVNCVSPGWIDVSGWKKKRLRVPAELRDMDHRQHPAGRVGKPEDVAAAVAFLADPANEFLTGVNLVLDGGMTRKMIYEE